MSEVGMSRVDTSETPVRIGASADLAEAGLALCFKINTHDLGFVVRHQGTIHGYVNRCAHQALEMDWQPGRFFDLSGLYLICAVHGALFEPASGRCIDGPCRGRSLQKLQVIEKDGSVYWLPADSPSSTLSSAHFFILPPHQP